MSKRLRRLLAVLGAGFAGWASLYGLPAESFEEVGENDVHEARRGV